MGEFWIRLATLFKEYGSIMTLYILSSFIQMFPLVSVGILLNNELHFSASDLTFYYAAIFVPWNFRAIFGLISDVVPVFGYRRKFYLVVSYLVVASSLVIYGQLVSTPKAAYLVGVVLNIFFAFSESIVDAIAVDLVTSEGEKEEGELARQRRSTDIQSSAMAFRTGGSLISVPIAGGLSSILPARTIISLTAVFPVIAVVVTVLINIERPGATELVHVKTMQLFSYLKGCVIERKRPSDLYQTVKPVILPCIFIFLYASSPSSTVPFTNYLFTQLSFTSGELHAISLCGSIGGLCGTLIYWKAFRKSRGVRTGFVISVIISVFAAISRILVLQGWASIYFVCSDELIVNLAFRLTLMPVQIYASIAASAPQHLMFEGFIFGLFASIENWGGTVSGIISGVLAANLSLSTLIIVAASLSFVPLFALSLLKSPTVSTEEPTSDSATQSSRGISTV